MENKKENTRDLLIGIGIGLVAGGAIGYGVGYSVTKKKADRRAKEDAERKLKKMKRELYEEAHDEVYEDAYAEATVEAQKVIAGMQRELKKSLGLTEEEAGKTIENAMRNVVTDGVKAAKESVESKKNLYDEVDEIINEGKDNAQSKEEDSEEFSDELASLTLDPANDQVIVNFRGESIAVYPRQVFFKDNGESYDSMQLRTRLIEYEKNIKILQHVWEAFGWGEYKPDPTRGVPSDEEIDNWLRSFDGENEKDEDDDDVEIEHKLERRSWVDRVKEYNANPENWPRLISQRDYEEESKLEQITVNYFAGDNMFIENTDTDTPIDPIEYFGVADGNELFNKKPKYDPEEDDNDPDIVRVENFAKGFVAEVTRFSKSWSNVQDGSVYLDGSTT